MANYRTSQSIGDLAPPAWQQGPYGKAYFQALGGAKDEEIDRLNQGIKCRFPQSAPPDALPIIGRDRLISRAVAVPESDQTFRGRLQQAWSSWAGADDVWQHWGGAGSAASVMAALFYEGYTFGNSSPMIFTALGPYYYLDNTNTLQWGTLASPWYFGKPFMWNRFQLIFVAPFLPGWTFTGPGVNEQARIRALVKQWKRSAAICAGITFFNGIGGPAGSVAGELWGYPGVGTPPGNPGLWGDAAGVPAGDPAVWGGNSVTIAGVY